MQEEKLGNVFCNSYQHLRAHVPIQLKLRHQCSDTPEIPLQFSFFFTFKVMHILVKTPTALTLDIFAILNAPFTNHILGTNKFHTPIASS